MENSSQSRSMTAAEAVSLIRAAKPDPTKFKIRARGFIDWKFGELAEFKGFAGAVMYAESAAGWVDKKATDSLLLKTYAAFRAAEKLSLI